MPRLKLERAFTLLEPGPVVLVTTHDGKRPNIMTLSWTRVMGFTPLFALTTGAWNHSFAALRKTRECLANMPCRVVDIVRKHDIVVLEALSAVVDTARKEQRMIHAVGDGNFIADGRRFDRRKAMASRRAPGL